MKPVLCLLVLPLLIPASFAPLQAQTPDTKPDASPSEPTFPIPERRVGSTDEAEVLIRTRTGEMIPFPLGSDIVEELLQRAQEQRSVPRYTIAEMEIAGTINRDEVQLKLELQVDVSSENEWVTVPLVFGDVYVSGPPSVTHAMPHGQGILASGDLNTRQWHLKGKGLHTIRLNLIGRTRSVSPGVSQLNLNLPVATASHALLDFASPVELQKPPAGTVDRATRDQQGVRQVEYWGLTAGFSLTWSEVIARVAQKPVIQVQNRMKLDLTTIPVTLTGTQVLQISGSPVNEIRVTFPEGFKLLEADARNAAGVSVLNNFESSPGDGPVSALIRLTSAMEGVLTLSFDLELMNRHFPQDIRVSLPAIQNANQQPGDLDILFPTGLMVQQKELKGVQRNRVTSESDLSVASTAFRMRSPESLVVLHVEETEAQFAVSPEVVLQPDPQHVLMTARYPVSVLKGSLLDLSLVWPGYSSGEWQILPGTMRLTSGKANLPLSMRVSEADSDVLELTFPERQSGEFLVEFRAYAALAAVRAGTVQLRCPEVQSRRGQPFVLTTIESDAYSIRPISMGTGELLPTVPMRSSAAAEKPDPGRKSESWLHDDPSIPVRLELPSQAPSVRAEIVLGMQPREKGIEVQELIRFEIEHLDMASFSLQVPDGIRPIVRVAGQSEPLRATIDWSFQLPEARRGSLNVEVTYLWPAAVLPENTPDHVYQLPVILPRSSEIRSVQAGTSSLSGLRISDETKWVPVFSERFESAMETRQPVTTIPLKWYSRLLVTSATSPDLLFAQTRIIGMQAITSTLAVFDSVPEFISVETPDDLEIESIRLGTESLTSVNLEPSLMDSRRIAERRVIRRTISARRATTIQNGPLILEFRVREKLPDKAALWLTQVFRRAVIVGESPAVPVVWYLGSQDEFQAVSAASTFNSLTLRGATVLPGGDNARTLAERQLRAVLAPYSPELQRVMTERAEEWLDQPGRQDVFFGSADSGFLRIYLVPQTSLLLISALACVLFFLLMSVFRQLTITVPLLLFSCAGLITWLIFPERTLMLAPYAFMGIIFGVLSITFQRYTTDRQMPFSGHSRTTERPTVFGFSGVITPPATASGDSAVSSTGRPSEISVSSAR